MAEQARRTRGPRTPAERARDAARSTATRLEQLPSSHFAETKLKPLAAALRFMVDGPDETGERLEQARCFASELHSLLRAFEGGSASYDAFERVAFLEGKVNEFERVVDMLTRATRKVVEAKRDEDARLRVKLRTIEALLVDRGVIPATPRVWLSFMEPPEDDDA